LQRKGAIASHIFLRMFTWDGTYATAFHVRRLIARFPFIIYYIMEICQSIVYRKNRSFFRLHSVSSSNFAAYTYKGAHTRLAEDR
jgi:hypothetical protein